MNFYMNQYIIDLMTDHASGAVLRGN